MTAGLPLICVMHNPFSKVDVSGESKFKMRPLPWLGFDPDLPPMAFKSFTADRQANACPFIFGTTVQTLEWGENLFSVCWFESNAVILYAENPLPGVSLCCEADDGSVVRHEFERIIQEILVELGEQGRIAPRRRAGDHA
jgi:hypothetical protein